MIYKLDELYQDVEKLRKNVDMKKFEKLAELNKNDKLYGWAFQNEDVLNETLEDLKSDYSQEYYIHDVLLVYQEILMNCQR